MIINLVAVSLVQLYLVFRLCRFGLALLSPRAFHRDHVYRQILNKWRFALKAMRYTKVVNFTNLLFPELHPILVRQERRLVHPSRFLLGVLFVRVGHGDLVIRLCNNKALIITAI